MAGDRLPEEAMEANAAVDAEEAKRADHKACLNLGTELPDDATQHFLISHAADREEMAWMLSESLSDRGYTVRLEPVGMRMEDDSAGASVDSSLVVVPIVSEGFLESEGATDGLRWAREGEKVVQPTIHVSDKRRISEWIGRVPPWLRSKDWIDLHPGDADYWACGVRKLLKGAGDEASKLAAERHDKSEAAPPTARRSTAKDPRNVHRRPWTTRRSKPSPSSGSAIPSAAPVQTVEEAVAPSGATPATKHQLSSKAAGKLPANQSIRRPSLLPVPKASSSGGTEHDVRDSMAEAEVEFRAIMQEFDHGTTRSTLAVSSKARVSETPE